MDTGGTGFLRDAADVIFDLFAGDHHQIGQLNDLGVDEDELDILGAGTEQEADDDGVDADRLTTAGRTCNQQMGHLAQVGNLCRTGNILTQGHGQRAAHVDVILGFKHRADVDGRANFIGHLDADGGFAGDGGLDTHTGGGQVQGNVIGQTGDAADLNARLGLQFISGNRRAAADVQHGGLDAEAVQR